ncbi:MAG: hypothetical protein ACPG49_07320 [Chitinophagales bacterium]
MKRFSHILLFFILAFTFVSLNLFAQNDSIPSPPCSTPEFRQFDFWLGDWEVYSHDKIVGTNKVELILGSCVIQENWEGKGGSLGKSFNTYNAKKRTWHQVWVDNLGSRIDFNGYYENNQMLFSGEGVSQKNPEQTVYYKLTFFKNKNGTVRQLWEASYDKEKWNTIFDGLYLKRK